MTNEPENLMIDQRLINFRLRKDLRTIYRNKLVENYFYKEKHTEELYLFVQNVSGYINELNNLHQNKYTIRDEQTELKYTNYIIGEWMFLSDKYKTVKLKEIINKISYCPKF